MTVRRRWGVWLLGIATIASVASVASAAPKPARPSDSFADSIGVNTRWKLPDSPYRTKYNEVKELLKELKVRYVRDESREHVADLFVDAGVKSSYVGTVPLEVDRLSDDAGALAAVEGLNQADVRRVRYGASSFPESALRFQEELYDAVKNDNKLIQIPVVSPTMALHENLDYLFGLKAFDVLALPPFLEGTEPARVAAAADRALKVLGSENAALPWFLTEAGCHTALAVDVGTAGVSDRAQAKYLQRLLAHAFNAGIDRTYLYELLDAREDPQKMDPEANYGLVRHDLSPKPAFYAIKNLVQILEDPGAEFPQRALDVEVASAEPSIRHTLLQKRDGAFYLMLWNEVPSFNQYRGSEGFGQDIENKDVTVRLSFGQMLQEAELYRPVVSGGAVQKLEVPKSKDQTLTVEVPDELVIVRVVPIRRTATKPPGPPTGLSTKAEGTTATLNWSKPKTGRVSGYFVWRQGRFLGQTAESTFTDQAMNPETSYRYEVAAHDDLGNVSDRIDTTAMAGGSHPDLVITDVSWFPMKPRAGQDLRLSAVVKNKGTMATPGVEHAVRFEVDGQVVNWSNESTEPLPAGGIRRIHASAGISGGKFWPSSEEPVTITAVVDPDDGIAETDEHNNTFNKTFPGVPQTRGPTRR